MEPSMTVTPIYAAILALIYVFLSVRVIGARRSARVALGDGGNPLLLRRQRVHANFAEYVPLALILMLLAEQQATAPVLLHALGALLLVGRVVHAVGVSREPEQIWQRVTGMSLTFTALVAGALINLLPASGLL
jgi:uncharacterized membrane protein YecN with MAPEG domain